MDLQTAIDAVLVLKPNEEFALFYFGDGQWRAELVNPSKAVLLGEADGEFRGEGRTAVAAVIALNADIWRAQRSPEAR